MDLHRCININVDAHTGDAVNKVCGEVRGLRIMMPGVSKGG